jgi:adenylate cyclase
VQLPTALVAGLLWQQRNVRRSLGKYLPPNVAETLRTSPIDIHLTDRPVYGVCLATDVQNYTTLSESVPPSTLAGLTNGYFKTLFDCVKRRHGVVTGIAGDGVMSVWASPQPEARLREQAVLAALDSLVRIDAFNDSIAPRSMPTRLGLSAGWMALGNVGGAGHYSYNALGDVPNTASRVENLNKHLGTRVLATEEVVCGLPNVLIRRIGRFQLKGKEDAVSIFEILGPLATSRECDRLRCEAYAEAFALFEQGRWTEAAQRFSCLTARIKDGPADYMMRMSRQRLSCPPELADPVIKLTSK